MFFAACLLTLLTLSITGSPVEIRNSRITLPMTRRPKVSNSTNLVQRDEARVAAFMDYSTHDRRTHIPATNHHTRYTVSVGIGDPATVYNLIVDTGSANTWVGAATPYVATGTSTNLRQPVGQTYGSASFEGMLWTDTISLTDGLTIPGMLIGVASEWQGIVDDGILGIGPAELTIRTMRNFPDETFPTVTDFLYKEGAINRALVGLSFLPSSTHTDGELSFGETDSTKYIGNIEYVPITTNPRSSNFWGINQSITYGTTEILRATAGIIDSGTTFLFIASDAYERYRAATGANFDQATRLLTITVDQYSALRYLHFHIYGVTYSLNRDAQIWPRSLNHLVLGVADAIYLVVKSKTTPTGHGSDFINGYVFLQRFYTAYDTDNRLVGFARTAFTDATTNY